MCPVGNVVVDGLKDGMRDGACIGGAGANVNVEGGCACRRAVGNADCGSAAGKSSQKDESGGVGGRHGKAEVEDNERGVMKRMQCWYRKGRAGDIALRQS